MIEAKDLRIGNLLITQNEEAEIITIDLIDGVEKLICGNALEGISLDCVSPILLTEDWLVKLGFTPTRNGATIKIEKDEVVFHYTLNCVNGLYFSVYNDVLIEHVHTLQNHFYLNSGGEELKLNN